MVKTTIVKSLLDHDYSEIKLPIFTIYESPADFEGKFVARLFDGGDITEYVRVDKDLQAIREEMMQMGKTFMPRFNDDPPVVKEVWI